MTEPLTLDVILAKFDANSKAWVLQDETSKQYVVIPHSKYPSRRPIHFFLKKEDAEAVLMELNDENWYLKNKNIFPVKVKLYPLSKELPLTKTLIMLMHLLFILPAKCTNILETEDEIKTHNESFHGIGDY